MGGDRFNNLSVQYVNSIGFYTKIYNRVSKGFYTFKSFIVKSLKIYKLSETKYQKIHEIDFKQTGSDKIFWIRSTRTLLDQVNRHIKPLVGVLQLYKDR